MSNQAVMANPTEQVGKVITQLDKLTAAVNSAKTTLQKQNPDQLAEALKTYQQKFSTIEQTTQYLQSIGCRK